MGLTKGTEIKVVKVGPLGDPIEIEIRGFKLSLRKKEAEILKLRRIS
jgi:ferrous iron transport protein A